MNKYKIEVKTQANIYTPKNDWTCHVPNANATQKCDFYAFVFVNLQKNEAYCKGMITKEKWLKVRQFKQKGEMGHKDAFECDTWVVQIKDLTKI